MLTSYSAGAQTQPPKWGLYVQELDDPVLYVQTFFFHLLLYSATGDVVKLSYRTPALLGACAYNYFHRKKPNEVRLISSVQEANLRL